MDDVFHFKKFIFTKFDGFFKRDVSKKLSYWELAQQFQWQRIESLTVYLLVVNGSKISTKNFASCM